MQRLGAIVITMGKSDVGRCMILPPEPCLLFGFIELTVFNLALYSDPGPMEDWTIICAIGKRYDE